METEIRDVFGNYFAKVKFNEPASRLSITKIAFGFAAKIPITVYFTEFDHQSLKPIISNFSGEIYATNHEGKGFAVGVINQPEFQMEHRVYKEGVESYIKWTGSFSDLALFEKIREGKTPKISISLHGELSYLLKVDNLQRLRLRSESKSFWLNPTIEFPKEIWIEQLKAMGTLENILIEVPLPSTPPSPWDEVWKALLEARQSFEQGGTTAWKNCIVSTRLALEKWQKIEKEDMGAGWKAPSVIDRQARTKEQRLDNIRWHILQYAHYSAHSHADNWTRDDALLMLTTLCALLSKRNP